MSISYAVFCLKKKKNIHDNILFSKHIDRQYVASCRLMYILNFTLLCYYYCSITSLLLFIIFFLFHLFCFFFFNDTATTEIYTLSLDDALPISDRSVIRRNQD